jgi:2-polyprenyl-3-methyl-5-hydroxy-6-metoxy-1,4-benzoquinol methylase
MTKINAQQIVEQNRETYNAVAEAFSGTRSFVWPDINFLLAHINERDQVADVGCGNGRLYEFIVSKGAEYRGFDYSANIIAEARKKYPKAKFSVANILDFKSEEKVDVVISVSVLNHFPKELQAEVIQRMAKILKPGGKLLLINWNLWNIKRNKSVWRLPHLGTLKNVLTSWQSGDKKRKGNLFYYAFTKRELRKLLEKNNFSVLENLYTKKGKKSSMLFGENIVTVAKLK